MPSTSRPLGNDSEYLARREAQERAAAARSADPSARRAHESLANQYAKQLGAVVPTAS
jgi:hypothetical protein